MSRTRARMAREIRDRLAQILETEVADPRLRLVTVVEVRPSADLSFARVFYRTLGDEAEATEALAKAKPFLRRKLAALLQVRRVPELDLRLDPTPEVAARIDEVLARVAIDDLERRAAPEIQVVDEDEPQDAAGSAADAASEVVCVGGARGVSAPVNVDTAPEAHLQERTDRS